MNSKINEQNEYSVKNKAKAIYFNKKVYNKEYSKQYDQQNFSVPTFRSEIVKKNTKKIIRILKSLTKEKLKLLDGGCGSGHLSLNYYNFTSENDFIYNLDCSKEMLNVLKSKISSTNLKRSFFICNDCYEYLNSSKDKFNLIGFHSSLHHFFDYLDVIDISCKRLTKGGILYIAREPVKISNRIVRYVQNILTMWDYSIYHYQNNNLNIVKLVPIICFSPLYYLVSNSIVKNKILSRLKNKLSSKKNQKKKSGVLELQKAETIKDGLDLEEIKIIFKKNKMKIKMLKGGADEKLELMYKINNFLKTNKTFQLIAQK